MSEGGDSGSVSMGSQESGQSQSQSTETKVSSAPSQSSIAAAKAKLQSGGRGQVVDRGVSAQGPQQQAGQAKEAPVSAEGAKTQKQATIAQDAAVADGQSAASVVFDAETQEWLKKVGHDPANPDVAKLVKSYRDSQRELTRAQQQAKATETIEAAKVVQTPVVKEEEKGPLADFEEAHNYHVGMYCAANGVSTIDELRQKDPDLAWKLQMAQVEGRQAAWEKEQVWRQQKHNEALEKQRQEQQFAADLKASEQFAKENLLAIAKDYPQVNDHFKQTGVGDLLKYLEDKYTIPETFLLSNEKIVQWFAKAAKAMDFVSNMDKHEEAWKQKYEKSLKDQKKAVLPSSVQGVSPNLKTAMGMAIGSRTSGISIK